MSQIEMPIRLDEAEEENTTASLLASLGNQSRLRKNHSHLFIECRRARAARFVISKRVKSKTFRRGKQYF